MADNGETQREPAENPRSDSSTSLDTFIRRAEVSQLSPNFIGPKLPPPLPPALPPFPPPVAKQPPRVAPPAKAARRPRETSEDEDSPPRGIHLSRVGGSKRRKVTDKHETVAMDLDDIGVTARHIGCVDYRFKAMPSRTYRITPDLPFQQQSIQHHCNEQRTSFTHVTGQQEVKVKDLIGICYRRFSEKSTRQDRAPYEYFYVAHDTQRVQLPGAVSRTDRDPFIELFKENAVKPSSNFFRKNHSEILPYPSIVLDAREHDMLFYSVMAEILRRKNEVGLVLVVNHKRKISKNGQLTEPNAILVPDYINVGGENLETTFERVVSVGRERSGANGMMLFVRQDIRKYVNITTIETRLRHTRIEISLDVPEKRAVTLAPDDTPEWQELEDSWLEHASDDTQDGHAEREDDNQPSGENSGEDESDTAWINSDPTTDSEHHSS